MNIERLKSDSENVQKSINSVSNMRLGMLLKKASYTCYQSELNRGKKLLIEPFSFGISCHDTGIDTCVRIINGDEELVIINGTYWYNESQYGFNEFTRLKGAWDASLELAIEKIRTEVKTHLVKKLESNATEIQRLIDLDNTKVSRFEEMFK